MRILLLDPQQGDAEEIKNFGHEVVNNLDQHPDLVLFRGNRMQSLTLKARLKFLKRKEGIKTLLYDDFVKAEKEGHQVTYHAFNPWGESILKNEAIQHLKMDEGIIDEYYPYHNPWAGIQRKPSALTGISKKNRTFICVSQGAEIPWFLKAEFAKLGFQIQKSVDDKTELLLVPEIYIWVDKNCPLTDSETKDLEERGYAVSRHNTPETTEYISSEGKGVAIDPEEKKFMRRSTNHRDFDEFMKEVKEKDLSVFKPPYNEYYKAEFDAAKEKNIPIMTTYQFIHGNGMSWSKLPKTTFSNIKAPTETIIDQETGKAKTIKKPIIAKT